MASPLTPAVRFATEASFPTFRKDVGSGQSTLQLDSKETVVIESSAEFFQYDMPGSQYGSRADFVLIHDVDGQPMILSIGTDKHLYICAYVNGGLGSWQMFDITPGSNFEPTVFDASKSPNNKSILIAVSGHEKTVDKSNNKLYHIVFECPKLTADKNGSVNGELFQNLQWLELAKNISSREVQSLVCEYYGGEPQYQILAGVSATTLLEGSHYVYSPSKAKEWILVKFPQQVERILSCVPANLPSLGAGHFVLFEDKTANKAVSCLFLGDGVSKQIFLTGLRTPTKLSASVNRRGFTDLLITAENGVGFIDSKKTIEAPVHLLQDIACQNVLGSEYSIEKDQNLLLIYAVSTHGEIYIVEGIRKASNNNVVQFKTASVPLPIRSDVRNAAGKINPFTGAFEIIYISKSKDALKHLARDPITSLWKETDLIVKEAKLNQRIGTPAFLVNITLSNGKGAPVPAGYHLQLTSSPTLAYINGRSYNLDQRSQIIPVNQYGQLQIVIPTRDSMSAAPIKVRFLPDTHESRVFNIQPAQRVLHTFGSFKSGDSLKNAKTSDSRPFFSEEMKQKHKDSFDQAAGVFARLPLMVASSESTEVEHSPKDQDEITIAWQKDEKGASKTSTDWMSNAVDAVGEVLGDVIEYLKMAVKAIVKVALKFTGPFVRLILKIGAKVIRFVLDSVSSIVGSLTYLLEGLFGCDLSSIRDLFLFRYKRVEATQKTLATVIDGGFAVTGRYLHRNHEVLNKSIDALGHWIEGYIARPYAIDRSSQKESSDSSILNNPIIANLLRFNPLGWILEAVTEEVGQDVQIPSLDLGIGQQIFTLLREQFSLLVGFLQRSWAGFEAAIGEPQSIMDHLREIFKDGFWTIFDSIKKIILSIYAMVMNSFDKIANFCRGKWKIPFISDLWEDTTNIDLTLINFVSYVAAQLFELFNLSSTPIFEKTGLSGVFDDLAKQDLPSILPGSLMKDLEAYDSVEASFETQMAAAQRAQREGAAYMAANPVTEPSFRLMMTATGHSQKSHDTEPRHQIPPTGVRYVIALARSGKALSRTANVAIEGLSLGNGGDTGSQSTEPSSQGSSLGGGGADGGFSSMPTTISKPDLKSSSLNFSMSLSTASTTGSLADLSNESASVSSQKASPLGGSKLLLIGSNAFAFGCRIVEQCLLHNYYDEQGQKAENYDGNFFEIAASLVGFMLSFFGDVPQILALSNIITSAGCFASSCIAPEKDFFRIAELVGSGSSTVSSGLFLVKEPYCQTAAWVGVGIDAANTCLMVGNQIYQASQPYVSKDAHPSKDISPGTGSGTKTPPISGNPLKPEVEPKDKDSKRSKKFVVDQPSDQKARAIENECNRIVDAATMQMRFSSINIPSPPGETPGPLAQMLRNVSNPLVGVTHNMPWQLGIDASAGAVATFDKRRVGVEGTTRPEQHIRDNYEQYFTGIPAQFNAYLNQLAADLNNLRVLLEELKDYVAINAEEV